MRCTSFWWRIQRLHCTLVSNVVIISSFPNRHDGLFKPLFGFLFPQFPSPNASLDSTCVSLQRDFRSTHFFPFNCNFASVLYRCGEGQSPQYKVLSLWNEVPVKVRGCDAELCDWATFEGTYKRVEGEEEMMNAEVKRKSSKKPKTTTLKA